MPAPQRSVITASPNLDWSMNANAACPLHERRGKGVLGNSVVRLRESQCAPRWKPYGIKVPATFRLTHFLQRSVQQIDKWSGNSAW